MEQITFPSFVLLPVWMNGNIKDQTLIDSEKSVVNINPLSVYYYYPRKLIIDGNEKELITVCVGGGFFLVDMNLKDFDELWDGVKRSFEMKEDWQG